jgi:soluble lytic murein transglycosylase-like protein
MEDTAWLDWLVSPAVARGRLDPATVKKLNSWVPKTEDMDTYLPMVADVLNDAVRIQLGRDRLNPRFHEVFRQLVLTAAWQESCWRQFAVKDAKRVPLKSGSGDIGLMQINERVWRGLYDLQGLRWDMVYNARAGTDILENYMIKYSIRHREQETTGGVDNLARSAYAAYNGGPRAYDRYRRPDASGHGKKVDTLFYEKFRLIKSGRELSVMTCFK